MKKKYPKSKIKILEKEMLHSKAWEEADHVVSYAGPLSVYFPNPLLKKLHLIAQVRHIPIHRLIRHYVKCFVEDEYALLEGLK